MGYKIDNAIIKKEINGNIRLIDPEGKFRNEDTFIAIKSDDLITLQLLINSIVKNDFKHWNKLDKFDNREPVKSLFVKLGYSKSQIADLLKEF